MPAAAQSRFFHLPTWNLSLRSALVPDGAAGDPSARSPAWLRGSALRNPHTRSPGRSGDHSDFFTHPVDRIVPARNAGVVVSSRHMRHNVLPATATEDAASVVALENPAP